MKDFSNYNEISTRMVVFTDNAPENLRGKKIPVGGSSAKSLHFDARFDMDRLTAYEIVDKEYAEHADLPTINDLLNAGIVAEWRPYKEANLSRIDANKKFWNKGQLRIEAIQEYFKGKGFTVSAEAIMHNFEAWKHDMKSGYRDEENNCHVFSPCGCNHFSLTVTELYSDCVDWQDTYQC